MKTFYGYDAGNVAGDATVYGLHWMYTGHKEDPVFDEQWPRIIEVVGPLKASEASLSVQIAPNHVDWRLVIFREPLLRVRGHATTADEAFDNLMKALG